MYNVVNKKLKIEKQNNKRRKNAAFYICMKLL